MKQILFILTCCLFSMGACSDADLNDPKGSTAVPDTIKITKIVNIPGASIIYYDRPDDSNLKYVKATYTTDDGVDFDANASYYTDSILINGFGAAGNYEVKLYSVSFGETRSKPIIAKIAPLTPPYITAKDNMKILPTFAGFRVVTDNETGAKLVLVSYKKNEVTSEWDEIGVHYSLLENIGYAVRGQDSIKAKFGIKVRDRWGHWSEMKVEELTPWYETECDKSKFKEVTNLDSDDRKQHVWGGSNTAFANLWDKQILKNQAKVFHTTPGISKLPQHFTIDLGTGYLLSRVIMHPRGQYTDRSQEHPFAGGAGSNVTKEFFNSGHPQRVQIYGADAEIASELKDDIADPSWVLLGEYELTRADGSLDTQSQRALTEEDKALILRGHEMIINDGAPKVKFVRFRTMMTYNSTVAVMIDELTFYGSDK